MTTLSATATSLLNLHYAILGSQPTLAQLNTYAGEYNKARAAGATADAAMDAIATHILATDAAVNTLMPNLSSASTLATSILANVGIKNEKIVEFITKALDGSLFGFAFPLNQAVRVISDYVANYKTGMAADASWDADLLAAKAVVAARPVPQAVGQSFTLTTGVDLVTGSAGADNFYGSIIGDLGTGTTLNPGDNLNGGAGADALNLTISGNPTAISFLVQSTSVEQLNIGNYDSDNTTDATLALSTAAGVTGVAVTGGNGDTQMTGLAALVNLSNTNGTGDMAVTYAAGVLSGTADIQAITLNNVGLSNDSVAIVITDASSTAGAAETVAITSNGAANFVTLSTNNNSKTVTATGAGKLTLDANAETTITKLDGSALTASLTVSNLGASNIAITGGSANDTVIDFLGNFDASDTISGGDGTDSLGLTAAITSANTKNITGFETLMLGDAVSQAVNAFTGITTLVVDHTAVNGSSDPDGLTSTFSSAAGTESLAIRTQGTSDNVTVSLATNGTADSIAVTLGTASAGVTVATLDLDNYETITLTSGGSTNTITDLTATSLKTLNIAGSKAIVIDANSTGTWNALKTVDASQATANVEFGSLDGAGTIVGGSGNDTFTGSSSADNISGGAGNDALTGGGGNDTLAGGDGNDTIIATGTANDVITGGAGDDTITGATGNDNIAGDDGNDTINANYDEATTTFEITSADTIVGGAGTDVISLTATDAAGDNVVAINFSGPTLTNFANVSGIEGISFADTADAITLSLGDIALGAFGGNISVSVATAATAIGHSVNSSAVLNTASKVTFTGGTGVNTYTVGNGIDVVNLSSGDDSINVTNILFLQAGDSLAGGAGTDTLSMDVNASATVTAAQLAALSSVEKLTLVTDATAEAYVVTVNDTIVTNNRETSTGNFTIEVTDNASNGTLRVDGATVTAGNLILTGGRGADTLTGGSGNDSITGGVGTDTLTGGAGNDTFVFTSTATVDDITDFSFGTSTTAVDLIKMSAAGMTGDATLSLDTTPDTVTKGSAVTVAGTDVLVVTDVTYANAAALDTALEAINGVTMTNDFLVLYQDSIGNVRLAYADVTTALLATGGNEVTTYDIAKFSGVTITGITSLVNTSDFSIVA